MRNDGLLKGFFRSFQYASDGLKYAFATQRNMRIHFFFAVLVIFLGLGLGISKWEVLLVFVAIVFVVVAELFNTAIEQMVDLATENRHLPQAKIAKDVAAGAVLLTAGFAVLAGIAVFYQPVVERSIYLQNAAERANEPYVILGLTMLFFVTLMLQVWLGHKKRELAPSLMMGLMSCLLVMVGLIYPQTIGLGRIFFLWLVIFVLVFLLRRLTLFSLLAGSLLGGCVALLSYQLYF